MKNLILIVLFILFSTNKISSQTIFRTVTTTGIKAWSSASTWQGGVVPPTNGTATVYISAAIGTYSLLSNNVYTIGTINVKDIIVENGANIELFSGTTTIVGDFINNGTVFTRRNNPSRTSTIRIGGNLTTNTTSNPLGSYHNTSDTNQTLNFEFNGTTAQFINGSVFFGPIGKTQNLIFNNTSSGGITIDTGVEVVNDVTNNLNSNVKINKGKVLSIGNKLTNNGAANNFIFENNSSLVQVNNIANTGPIKYKRTATQRKLDYVYWASPVANFNLSNHTSNGPKYYWNPTIQNSNGTQGNWETASGILPVAKGVIVRGPSTFTTAIDSLTVEFDGVPTNGNISIPISRGSIISETNINDNWNLIGNPYPSSISAKQFLQNNSTVLRDGIYIWTHGSDIGNFNSPFYENFTLNYNPNDYVLYNLTGFNVGPTTDYYIGAGQGFFVAMVDGSTGSSNVSFNNTLRNKQYGNDTNTNFFRMSTDNNVEEGRIWINLVNSNNFSTSRTLIGYVDGATNQQDNLNDAISSSNGSSKIYTLTQEQPLVIQGRQLPFDDQDKIPVGYDIATTGNYSIAIHAVDGFFEDNQNIYLEDLNLNIIHNLKESPYQFNTSTGVFRNRFVLRFTNSTLGNNDFEINNLIIHTDTNINIKSPNQNIKSVEFFDLLGRNILTFEGVNNTLFTTNNINKTNNLILIRVTLENGISKTYKLIF
jgi:hypothetical protein